MVPEQRGALLQSRCIQIFSRLFGSVLVIFKLLNKKIEKSYFEHWKFLRIRAQDEEIFLRRIAMKLGKKAIAAAMRKWKGLVKEINSLNYRGSLIKRVIGHIAKEKLHFYWYKFKRICRRYKQLEMEGKLSAKAASILHSFWVEVTN